MRGTKPPSAKRRAATKARREFEARARCSLALRHGQQEFDRSVELDTRKALERRMRGHSKERSMQRKAQKERVKRLNARRDPPRAPLNTRWPGGYTELQATARRFRQMEGRLGR